MLWWCVEETVLKQQRSPQLPGPLALLSPRLSSPHLRTEKGLLVSLSAQQWEWAGVEERGLRVEKKRMRRAKSEDQVLEDQNKLDLVILFPKARWGTLRIRHHLKEDRNKPF